MKNILYVLIISVIFSCNISYPMQQSITTEKIGMLVCITAGCGISLYIANQYKYSLLHWFKSFYRHMDKTDSSTKQQNQSQQNQNLMIMPQITTKDLEERTAQYLKEEALKKELLRKEEALKKEFLKKEALIKGTTDLHTACENNDAHAVKLLLEKSTTDINTKRDRIDYRRNGVIQAQGETPLHIACHNRNKEIIEILLACNGIDVTIQKRDGNTPLHIACKTDNQELDSTFLKKIWLIHNICDQQSSPCLFFPTELKKQITTVLWLCDKDIIVEKLLTCNASNINTQNDRRESALYLSYFHNHKNTFSLLFSQDNIDLTDLLSLACNRNDMTMITQLLNHKNIKLNSNEPLYIACENGYSDIVTLLLTYNKNNCMKINDQYHNPLLAACEKVKKPNPNRIKFVTIIQALLNDPAIDINTKTTDGLTVFHFVVSDCELLRLLLDKDDRFISEKDNGCPSDRNATPLHKAIEAGNLESIFLLLQHGADISVKNRYTPLALACKKASEEIKGTTYKDIVIQLLKSFYVNQEIINSSECLYALDLKEKKTDDSVPKLLLAYGADPNRVSSRSHYGCSPLLEVAQHNLPLLNLFIDQYNGDSTQKNSANKTVLYIAFMSENIKNPNEINFFNNLNADKKRSFMERELTIVADFTPKNIFERYPHHNTKETNNRIKLFNSFIATCIYHGKIDINEKLINNGTLLDTANEKLQKRRENFYSSKKDSKSCMHSTESICHYTHDSYSGYNSYNGCYDCYFYFPYNEVIAHALVQHINPTTTEQAVDKTIALTYKEEPNQYYLKTVEERENQKNYLKDRIKTLNSHH